MLINTWYVAADSADLKDKPVRVKMLGQYFALFRGEDGIARAVSDVCIHRGGSLSGGKVKKNCMVKKCRKKNGKLKKKYAKKRCMKTCGQCH